MSRHRAFQKEELRVNGKQRAEIKQALSAVGPHLDRPGDAEFPWANSQFLQLQSKIAAGWLTLGDWLGHYRVLNGVGICAPLGVRKLGNDCQWTFKKVTKGLSQL